MRVVGRFADERQAGEDFRAWLERSGGANAIADELARPRSVGPHPKTPRTIYIDFGETGPYVAEVGEWRVRGT